MRPTANIIEEGDTLPFLNATLENIYLKKNNSYVKIPFSSIRILPVFRTEVRELNGITILTEQFEKFTISPTKGEKIPLERKILIVTEAVFDLPLQTLSELRKLLGIAGVAIPEMFIYDDEKNRTLVEALKVKFF